MFLELYINELHCSLPPLHVEGLGGVSTLGQLAGDGVQGARPLVKLVNRVECQGLRCIGYQLCVGLEENNYVEGWLMD